MEKEKVIYQITRYKVATVEVASAEEKQVIETLNRDFERIDKADKTYAARCSSLEEMQRNGFDIIDESANPEERMIENERKTELKECMRIALKQLNERQQEMVQMVYFEDKTQDEVAEHYGISKQAVSNAMQRIYATLKKILEKF